MGSFLSSPVTDKSITLVHRAARAHVVGEMQGYRTSMEDAYCDIEAALQIDQIRVPITFYAVFDGHGGGATSRFLAERFAHVLLACFQAKIDTLDQNSRDCLKDPANSDTIQLLDYNLILRDAFQILDVQFYQRPNNNSGSTAVASIIFKDLIITANVGDSRSILSRGGVAKHCSFDHKPKNIGELMRIHNNGGFVVNNRVNGILALSRAFGDFSFKMHATNMNNMKTPPENYQVTVTPDVIIHQFIPDSDEFLVLACDGIWDCINPKELVSSIRHLISLGKNLDEIVEIILDQCIGMADTTTGIGFDNMTIIIVALFPEQQQHQSLAPPIPINLPSYSVPSSQESSAFSLPERSTTGSTFKSNYTENDDGLHNWLSSLKNKVLDEKFGMSGH